MSSDASNSLIPASDTSSLQANPPGATTNLLATALTPPTPATRMTITVSVSAGSKFGVVATGLSSSATLQYMNAAVALTANSLYTFTIGVRSGMTYNFQLDTGAVTVNYFSVEFVYGYI